MRTIIVACLLPVFFALSAPPAGADSVSRHYQTPYSCTGAEEMLARDPKNLDLLIDLGSCAAVNSHPNRARVVGKLDAALKANPGDTRLLVLAAMVFAAESRSGWDADPAAKKAFAQAEKRFQEAARQSPAEGYIWYERALATLRWADKFSGPEKTALRKRAYEHSREALQRAPLDQENWNIWLQSALSLLENLEPAARPEQVRQFILEREEALANLFAESVPAPAGFVFNREFVRAQGRSAPAPGAYQALPPERRRCLLYLYLGAVHEKLADKADNRQFRQELATGAYDWYVRALRVDPSNLAAWRSIEDGYINDYPYHQGDHKKAWPGIVATVRARLADPAWPGGAESEQKYLRARIIYKTVLCMSPPDRRLTLAEEREGYELLREAATLSPQDLRNVGFWFDWGVGLYWQRELPRPQKKDLADEMKTVLDAALAANLDDLTQVAALADMEKDSPEVVREMLTEKWADYYRQLEKLK